MKQIKLWNNIVLLLILVTNFSAIAQEDAGVSLISGPTGIVCKTTFSATITLENFGSNPITSANILYNIDGAPNSTKAWTGTISPGQTVDVIISGLSAPVGTHVFNASTNLPNGGADANSSNDLSSSNFEVSAQITYSTTVSNATCGNMDGSIVVNVSGGVGSFQYSDDGGATFQTGNSFSSLGLGQYTIIAEDANGCRKMSNENVLNNGGPSILTVNGTNPKCYNEASGTIAIAASGTGMTYSINDGLTYQSLAYFPNLTAGFYSVFVKDNAGCEAFQYITLSNPDPITTIVFGNDANCNSANGSTSVIADGGASSFSYQWDDPSNQTTTSANNLSVGLYHVTVTDGDGCSVKDSVFINNINGPRITTQSSSLLCANDMSGSATANVSGGSAPFLYAWNDGSSQTTQQAVGLAAGTYEVIATDLNGCKGIGVAYVTEPSVITGTIIGQNTSCGESNGVAIMQLSGGTFPYFYAWDNPSNDTTAVLTNLIAGTYSINATDANGCSFSSSIFILGSTPMVLSDSINHESCAGMFDGDATIFISGGNAPFDILWSNDSTDTLISNLGSGQYSVTVTDADGCMVDHSISIVAESSECIIIPTAFSPNSDGKNDFFVIKGIESSKIVGVEVFNRWGEVVYQNTNYLNDWDGKYNEVDLPVGSYHCIIAIDEENYYLGPITIIR